MTATLQSTDPTLQSFADQIGPSEPVAIEGGRTRWDLVASLGREPELCGRPTGHRRLHPRRDDCHGSRRHARL